VRVVDAFVDRGAQALTVSDKIRSSGSGLHAHPACHAGRNHAALSGQRSAGGPSTREYRALRMDHQQKPAGRRHARQPAPKKAAGRAQADRSRAGYDGKETFLRALAGFPTDRSADASGTGARPLPKGIRRCRLMADIAAVCVCRIP